MRREQESTALSGGRVRLAILASALAGAALTGLFLAAEVVYVPMSLGHGGIKNAADVLLSVLLFGSVSFMYGLWATVVWALGLVLIGVPSWRLLRRCGVRSARATALLGAVLSFLTVAAICRFDQQIARLWLEVGVAGAVAGWVLQRVADRQAPTTIPPALPQ